jgi:RNA polymerase sigma-70 factor (ECF subfamily)
MTPNAEEVKKQEDFMRAYQPVHENLSRFVQSMVWNKEEVKDVIGETLLRTYENFENVRKKEALLSYMFTVAKRLIYKNTSSRTVTLDIPDNIIDHAASAESKTELKELYSALKELPEKQREAVTLFELSGFSLLEIQQIQGDTLSAVKSRIARGREKLGELLEKENV